MLPLLLQLLLLLLSRWLLLLQLLLLLIVSLPEQTKAKVTSVTLRSTRARSRRW